MKNPSTAWRLDDVNNTPRMYRALRVVDSPAIRLVRFAKLNHLAKRSSAASDRGSRNGNSSMAAHLKLIEPRHENRSVPPIRPANADLRSREYLTQPEVELLIKTAKDGRYGHRDATLILIAFRHGLRAVEICDLEWSQVEFSRSASLHVRRAKNGKPSVHPLRGDEIRMLRELRRQFPDSGFVFATERGGPFTAGRGQSPDQTHRSTRWHAVPRSRSHATAWLRLRTGERWPRYAGYPGLAWSSVNSAHRALHRTVADPVQRLLARLSATLRSHSTF